MSMHWLVILLLKEECCSALKRFGWLINHDWAPYAYPVILFLGSIWYIVRLEQNFVQQGKEQS
jgi:hypothetical protein